MRPSHVVVMAALLALAGSFAGAEEPLRIGYFDIPPHVTGVEDGRPRGAAISYFEERIAPHFGVSFEWDSGITAPTRLMSQLREGEIDAMIFLGRTEERARIFHYPDPYLVMPETIALRADHPVDRITAVQDLHGLRLGFLVGGRIPEPLRSDGITYDLIAGKRLVERNVEKLLLGRIDGIYAPLSTALITIAEDMGVRNRIKLLPIEFLEPVEIYTVFSKKTVTKDVVSQYNAALKIAKEQVEYGIFLENILRNRRRRVFRRRRRPAWRYRASVGQSKLLSEDRTTKTAIARPSSPSLTTLRERTTPQAAGGRVAAGTSFSVTSKSTMAPGASLTGPFTIGAVTSAPVLLCPVAVSR